MLWSDRACRSAERIFRCKFYVFICRLHSEDFRSFFFEFHKIYKLKISVSWFDLFIFSEYRDLNFCSDGYEPRIISKGNDTIWIRTSDDDENWPIETHCTPFFYRSAKVQSSCRSFPSVGANVRPLMLVHSLDMVRVCPDGTPGFPWHKKTDDGWSEPL